jgi:hypothetical protein
MVQLLDAKRMQLRRRGPLRDEVAVDVGTDGGQFAELSALNLLLEQLQRRHDCRL